MTIAMGRHAKRKSSSTQQFRLALALLVFLCGAITLRLHGRVLSEVGARDDPAEWVVARATDGSDARTSTSKRNIAERAPAASTHRAAAARASEHFSAPISRGSPRSKAHPRVTCFVYGVGDRERASDPPSIHQGESCRPSMDASKPTERWELERSSLPRDPVGKDEVEEEHAYGESDTCQYPAPPDRVAVTSVAPSTCNDVHSLGFDARVFDPQRPASQRESIEYITSACDLRGRVDARAPRCPVAAPPWLFDTTRV